MPNGSLPVPELPVPKGSLPALPFPAVPEGSPPPLPVLNAPLVPTAVAPAIGLALGCPALPAPLEVPPSLMIGPVGPVGEPITGPWSVSAPQANAQGASTAHNVRRANR
jgi:hypothetical protein